MKIEVSKAKDGAIELKLIPTKKGSKTELAQSLREMRDFLAMMRYLATGKKPH